MANKQVFPSHDAATATNHAGGKAYSMSARQTLAQLAHSGCFGDTFYANAKEQLSDVFAAAEACDLTFVAKCAVHARQRGYMKDMPAYLLAYIVTRPDGKGTKLAREIAPLIITNGKMLRNFVQVIRSNVFGRKNVSSAAIRGIVQQYFSSRSVERLFNDSVGNDPSLVDVLKLCRPKPDDAAKSALYAHLLGRKVNDIPTIVSQLEAWRLAPQTTELPNVSFQMLTSSELTTEAWTAIARTAPWTMTRMNLNTFARHGVFEDNELVQIVAERLGDKSEVERAMVFPYQLFMAYKATEGTMPRKIVDALHAAMEHATHNVLSFEKRVAVCVDVSGSMRSPVTQKRGNTPVTQMRCVDVAALLAAVILRKNDALIVPFDDRCHKSKLNSHDSVMTIAHHLAAYGGGGTDCSVGIELLNSLTKNKPEVVIVVSDNESWIDRRLGGRNGTGFNEEWRKYKKSVPDAKLVCIDLTPNTTSQVQTRPDTLLVGGFSDDVFDVISSFLEKGKTDHWADLIEQSVQLSV